MANCSRGVLNFIEMVGIWELFGREIRQED